MNKRFVVSDWRKGVWMEYPTAKEAVTKARSLSRMWRRCGFPHFVSVTCIFNGCFDHGTLLHYIVD